MRNDTRNGALKGSGQIHTELVSANVAERVTYPFSMRLIKSTIASIELMMP